MSDGQAQPVEIVEARDDLPVAPLAHLWPKDPEKWEEQLWRLHNLYYVVDKYGRKVKFQPNWAQCDLLENLWFLNVILKARQLGFTTFIDIVMLDNCLFHANKRAGIICHALPDAAVIFRDKVKFPFDNLPEGVREKAAPKQDSANELLFANNSSIRVGTSMRSGTLHYLHVSEYGKVCARTPDKAREIKTGALNTVQAGQIVWIESTAEGRGGHYHDLCIRAEKQKLANEPLSALDYKFHFYPWWQHPDYVLDPGPEPLVLPTHLAEYFEDLEVKHGIALSDARKLWYLKKEIDQGDDMMREYPSTPAEAFQMSIEGSFYRKQMLQARRERRIRHVPYIRGLPVSTYWDLGFNDMNAIWFIQHVGTEHRCVDYEEDSGESLASWVKLLQGKKYVYEGHYFPHDVDDHYKDGRTSWDVLRPLLKGMGTMHRVTRVAENRLGVEAVREILHQCWFDIEKCDKGIMALENFRKQWDEKNGVYKDDYVHDGASHGAKAFESFARTHEAIKTATKEPADAKKRGWRSRRGRRRVSHMSA